MNPIVSLKQVCLFILLFAVPASLLASPNNREFIETRTKLMEVSFQSDSLGLVAIQKDLQRFTKEKDLAPYAHYYLAFAQWQLAMAKMNQNQVGDDVKTLLRKAIANLKTATELKEDFADAYALNASCHFPFFTLEPNQVMQTATDLGALLGKAKATAPKNPRVVLVDAMNIFYTPEQFGGSQEKGISRFEEALELFVKQTKSHESLLPQWGQEVGYAWLANAYLQLKEPNPEKAKGAFEKSLALRSDFYWVRDIALPRVAAQLSNKQ